MVFGFGKGKIDIIIEKYNFSPGESINGRILLKLKKPIHAKAIKVGLLGERTTKEIRMAGGKTTVNQRNERVFSFEMS